MSLKQRQRTPIELADMSYVLGQAWRAEHGRNPTPTEGLSMLTLLALENNLGQGVMNHNWGNIATSPNDDRDYWLAPWMDDAYIVAHPEQRQQMFELRSEANAGRQPKAFRSYDSHLAGAGAFVQLLKSDTHKRITESKTADQLWRAVSLPHPTTKKSWCAGCDNEATRRSYQAMWNQLSPSFGIKGGHVAKRNLGAPFSVASVVFLIVAPLAAFILTPSRKKR